MEKKKEIVSFPVILNGKQFDFSASGNNIVCEEIKPFDVKKGGIIIPGSVKVAGSTMFKIISIGPNAEEAAGRELFIGDYVEMLHAPEMMELNLIRLEFENIVTVICNARKILGILQQKPKKSDLN